MKPTCADSPPSTPDPEDDPRHDSIDNDDSYEGGFLPEDTEDIPEGNISINADRIPDRIHDPDSAVGFVIQPPNSECPHYRVVEASGFIPPRDSLTAASMAIVPKQPDGSPKECCECRAPAISQKYLENFGVAVCQGCIDSNGEAYGLITKTTALDEYCLGDGDLTGLGCIRRRNPRKESWGEMKLLLRAQVAQRSLARHGSPEGLEQARRRRCEEAARRKRLREGRDSVLRKPSAARTPETAVADDGAAGLAAGRGKPRASAAARAAVARVAAPRHVHAWGEAWQDGGDDGSTWRRRCEGCGLVTTFEKL
jgi:DNA repair protein